MSAKVPKADITRLQRDPSVEEQRIVVVCVVSRAVEFIIVSILNTDTRISPWPYWRIAAAKRYVGNLRNKAVAVWTASTPGVGGIQRRV